jgi:exopolysaccharide production protein ExoZ
LERSVASAKNDGPISSLQALRAAAALLVLAHHTSENIVHGYTPFNIGYAGVDLFFVLSGFVIYFAHQADLGEPARLGRYAWRRFVRIYPTYIVVTLLSLPSVMYLFPDLRRWDVLVASVFINESPAYVLNVAWTLVHEVRFYIVFGLCILLPHRMFVVVLVALTGLAAWSDETSVRGWPIARIDLEFTMGILAAMLHLKWSWPIPVRYGCLAIGCAIFFAVPYNSLFQWGLAWIPSEREYGGFGAMLIVFGAAGLPFHWRIAERLGNASYLIYLLHYQTLVVVTALAWKFGLKDSALPALIAAGGIVFASVGLHEHIEAPVLSWLRHKGDRARLPTTCAPPTA